MVLHQQIQGPADDPDRHAATLPTELIAAARSSSRLPVAVHVPRAALANALSGVAEALRCRVVVSRRLPALREFRQSITARFGGG
jgi:hypothetical protein